MRYKIKFDAANGLPIPTKEYTLAQIAGLLGLEYERPGSNKATDQWEKIRDDWGPKIGERPNPTRNLILYAIRVARRDPAVAHEDREDQLVQICRKFKNRQPTYWERFLRERYQYAHTRDFFAVNWNEIMWEYYAYDDECDALGADPDATEKVFDAAKLPWPKEISDLVALPIENL